MEMLLLVLSLVAQSHEGVAATIGPVCVFEVSVKSPNGRAASGVPVSWSDDSSGFEYKSGTNQQGLAHFCDPPVLPRFTVRIGRNICAVTVHNVPSPWKEVRRIHVVYQDCETQEMFGFCHVLLRLRDRQKQPLSGVRLALQPPQPEIQGTFISDSLGRIYLSIALSTVGDGLLRKDGYSDQALKLECDPKSSTIEKTETLDAK